MCVETTLCASRHAATPAITDDIRLSFGLLSVSCKKVIGAFGEGDWRQATVFRRLQVGTRGYNVEASERALPVAGLAAGARVTAIAATAAGYQVPARCRTTAGLFGFLNLGQFG
jgi:hypothetical protein